MPQRRRCAQAYRRYFLSNQENDEHYVKNEIKLMLLVASAPALFRSLSFQENE